MTKQDRSLEEKNVLHRAMPSRSLFLCPRLMALCGALLPLPAAAVNPLLTIDTTSQAWIAVNGNSGVATWIGPSTVAINVDLCECNGTIYAVESPTSGPSIRLLSITPATGQADSLATLSRSDGGQLPLVEGVACVNGALVVSFVGTPAFNPAWSNRIADLALDGTVSNIRTFPDVLDFDGLGADSNRLLAVDARYQNQVDKTALYEIDLVGSSATLLEVLDGNGSNLRINDVVVEGLTCWGVDRDAQLFQIDLSVTPPVLVATWQTGLGQLHGLASGVHATSVPPGHLLTPASWGALKNGYR